MTEASDGGVRAWADLYWIPLGAGSRVPVVRWNGLVFEAISATMQGRPRCDLYHAGLVLHLDGDRYVIEMAPAWGSGSAAADIVGTGPVAFRWLGRSRIFRYQVRCWRDGVIPDLAFAVDGPRRVTTQREQVRRILDLAPQVPMATWGRDELRTGDMRNSNSLVAWLLARSGIDVGAVVPPVRGRAPGWSAGLVLAARVTPGEAG
ncbi:MAG: hypothetical protein GC156_02720 [Actinomycetales bacterium]|nr:hypothetical protein [Actinomycetales bacterium]